MRDYVEAGSRPEQWECQVWRLSTMQRPCLEGLVKIREFWYCTCVSPPLLKILRSVCTQTQCALHLKVCISDVLPVLCCEARLRRRRHLEEQAPFPPLLWANLHLTKLRGIAKTTQDANTEFWQCVYSLPRIWECLHVQQ